MSQQYCFVCAGDEGVFLDVTIDNNEKFREQLELCSLFEESTKPELLHTRICHKCVYELNQCSSFVQKFKELSGIHKQKLKKSKSCCCLCLESPKNGCIFKLVKDRNLLQNPIYKIQMLLDHDVDSCREEAKSICLNCRYTVDLLFDLKCVFRTTQLNVKNKSDENIDYSNFPKTKTTVLRRKTTVTESARAISYEISDSGSDTSLSIRMGRKDSETNKKKKSKNLKKQNDQKLRVCGKCQNYVQDGDDMYRIHTTGLTVCKSCKIETNPSTYGLKTRAQSIPVETKSCAVLLKDVLSDSALKQIRQSKSGYIVTDASSSNEDKSRKDTATTEKEIVIDEENYTEKVDKKRSRRKNSDDSSDSDVLVIKKSRLTKKRNADCSGRTSPKTALPPKLNDSAPPTTFNLRKRNTVQPNQNANSNSVASKASKGSIKITDKHKQISGESWSDADIDNRAKRKRLRNITTNFSKTKNLEDETIMEDSDRRRKRIRFASASLVTLDVDENKEEDQKRRISSSSSEIEVEVYNVKLDVSASRDDNPEKNVAEVIEIVENMKYVCDKCGAIYENKLVGLTHKLTHFKQPELKLEKVVAGNIVKDTPEKPLEIVSVTIDDDGDEEKSVVEVLSKPSVNDVVVSPNISDNVDSSVKEIVEDKADDKLGSEDCNDEDLQKIEETNLDNTCKEKLRENEDTEATKSTTEDSKDDKTDLKKSEHSRQPEDTKSNESTNSEEKSDIDFLSKEEENQEKDVQDNEIIANTDIKEEMSNEGRVEDVEESCKENKSSNGTQSDKDEEKLAVDVETKGTSDTLEKKEDDEELAMNEKENEANSEKSTDSVENKEMNNEENSEKLTESVEKKETNNEENSEKLTESVEKKETNNIENSEKLVESVEDKEMKSEEKSTVINDSSDVETSEIESKSVNKKIQNEIQEKSTGENEIIDIEIPDSRTLPEEVDDKITDSKEIKDICVTNDNVIQEKTKDDIVSTQSDESKKAPTENIEVIGEQNLRLEKQNLDSSEAATEIVQKLLDSATAEILEKQNDKVENDSDPEEETVEKISREIHRNDLSSLESTILNSSQLVHQL